MILLLFFACLIMMYISFNTCKFGLLSPTFWASSMFMVFSLIYTCTLSLMLSDISVFTFFVVTANLIITYVGEQFAYRVKLKGKTSLAQINKVEAADIISISKAKTIILTIVLTIVAGLRYRNFMSVSLQYAGKSSFTNVMEMMYFARYSTTSSKNVSLGNFFENQFVYVAEITAYMYIFIFVYNFIKFKRKQWWLLLPVIPHMFFAFMTTSRTAFIVLFLSIITSVFYTNIKDRSVTRILFSPRILIGVSLFLGAFFWYGRARNDVTDIPIIDYIQMYSCASIYGLDQFLVGSKPVNPYFGYRTLQNIYELFGIDHPVGGLLYNSMFVFNNNNSHSNINTSLALPIQDYGIFGTLVIRFFLTMLSTYVIGKIFSKNVKDDNFFVWIYFVVITIYTYFEYPIGDMFPNYIGNPTVLVRYFIYAWILVKIYLRPNAKFSKKCSAYVGVNRRYKL